MKKVLYLFITATLLISCSASDDNAVDLDPIIGKWQLQSMQENGQEQSTECERQSTVTFFENGTITITSFSTYYGENSACESEIETSTWENKGNSTYEIDDDMETVTVNFSENNTVFTVINSETYNGATTSIVVIYKKQ